MKITKVFWIALLLLPTLAFAQKTVELKSDEPYVYIANPDESPKQARERAANLAVVDILRNEFGTAVSGANATSLIEKNGITDSKFVSLSSTGELMGESLGYLQGYPKYEPLEPQEDGSYIIKVRVGIKARSLKNGVKIDTHILRNEPDIRFESEEFMHGDKLYMKFTTPAKGYLAVYLTDGESYSRLLPYARDEEGFFPVKANQEYTLFHYKNHSPGEDENVIDEYMMTIENEHADLNQIVTIFSPNKFFRPRDRASHQEGEIMYPATLSFEDFQKWMIETRRNDKDMTVETKYITIKPAKR